MKLVAVVFILAVCSGQVLSRRIGTRNILTDQIRKVLENSRPRLVNIQVDQVDLGDLGSLSGVIIRNLETFKIEELSAGGILSLRVKNLTLSIDILEIDGSYDFINADVPLIGNLSGQGNFSIGLRGVKIFTALSFVAKGLTQVVLDRVDDFVINVSVANALFDGIEGGEDTDNIISSVLPGLISDNAATLLQEHPQELVDAINSLLPSH